MRILIIFAALIVATEAAVEAGSIRRYRRAPIVTTTPTQAPVQSQKESADRKSVV